MNFNQLEKLKSTIQGSPILSKPERVEWLALLDLMNDKQLGELEKILGSNKQSAVSSQQSVLSTQQPAASNPQKVDGQKISNIQYPISAPKTQIPKLSHIMNLPSNLASKPASLGNASEKIASSQKIETPAKPQNAFTSKLKSIFAEKELSAPKTEQLLTAASNNQPAPAPKPIASLPALHFPEKSQPAKAPVQPPKPAPEVPPVAPAPIPKAQVPQVTNPSQSSPQAQIKENLPKPLAEDVQFTNLRKDLSGEVKAILEDKNLAKSPATPKDVVTPGLNFFQPAENTQAQTIQSIKDNLKIQPIIVEMAPIDNGPQKEAVFEQLKDLNALNVQALEAYNFNSLVKTVKNLIRKFGYHESIFCLEQSVLYKAYIKTGLELLGGQMNFEQLGSKQDLERYLTRKQFEKMADLLRQVQAG